MKDSKKRLHLEKLPDEILEHILTFLQVHPRPTWDPAERLRHDGTACRGFDDEDFVSRRALVAACSVSRRLRAICQPLLHRYLFPAALPALKQWELGIDDSERERLYSQRVLALTPSRGCRRVHVLHYLEI